MPITELAVQLSVLTNAARSLSPASAESRRTATAIEVLPPWDVRVPQPSESRRLSAALARPVTVALDDPSFDRPGVSEDAKKLFGVYKALSTLSTLAEEAAREDLLDARRNGLDARFQTGLTRVSEALSGFTFDALSLLWADTQRTSDTGLRVPRASSTLTGVVAVRGAFDAPVPGLTGSERFTARIVKNGVTSDVEIDLADLAGPPTLDAIVALANDRLAAAGMVTRLKRVALETDTDGIAAGFGIEIQGTSTERLSLIAAAAEPALYVAGASGDADGARGALLKFDSLDDAAAPAQFRADIAAEDGLVTPKASAVDGDGNVYVVGTAAGDVAGQAVKGESDLFLRKYDSVGRLIYSQVLGSAASAEGVSLAVGPDGGVVVAGRITGRLSGDAIGGGGDAFVAKFGADGTELFARQIAPLAEDGAASVAVADDGSIYVAGFTKAKLAGAAAHGGGADGFITKLSATGTLVYNRQFGGAGDERAAAIAIAEDGNVVVASAEDGIARVRKFAAADGTSAALWEKTLGDLAGGAIGQIAVSGARIFIAGSTSNAALDAGGEANVVAPASGGLDAFLVRIDDLGASATADFVSYLGSATLDRGLSLAVSGADVYLGGETKGALPGVPAPRERAAFAFAAKLSDTGVLAWTRVFTVADGQGQAASLAIDPQGASVLDALGLPRGEVNDARSRRLTDNSALRAGDSFAISVNGKAERRIRIEADDTLRTLALKINAVLLLDGKAELRRRSGADVLSLSAAEGKIIELKRGPDGSDALVGLGLKPVTLTTGPGRPESEGRAEAVPERPVFALGLSERYALTSRTRAAETQEALTAALAKIRTAYRELTRDPALDALAERQAALQGPVPPALLAQLSNYQAGLARLQAASPAGQTLSLF